MTTDCHSLVFCIKLNIRNPSTFTFFRLNGVNQDKLACVTLYFILINFYCTIIGSCDNILSFSTYSYTSSTSAFTWICGLFLKRIFFSFFGFSIEWKSSFCHEQLFSLFYWIHSKSTIISASSKLIIIRINNCNTPDFIKPLLTRSIVSSHMTDRIFDFFSIKVCCKDLSSVGAKK